MTWITSHRAWTTNHKSQDKYVFNYILILNDWSMVMKFTELSVPKKTKKNGKERKGKKKKQQKFT